MSVGFQLATAIRSAPVGKLVTRRPDSARARTASPVPRATGAPRATSRAGLTSHLVSVSHPFTFYKFY